jgi:hypothetical protein
MLSLKVGPVVGDVIAMKRAVGSCAWLVAMAGERSSGAGDDLTNVS